MKALGWLYFIVVQLIALACMVVGWVLLIPWSAMELWELQPSPYYPGRVVTAWNARWMQAVYGNWEDGVTGPSWYLPEASNWWRAYMWSAWRNSANNLRFVFRWYGKDGAPFWKWVSADGRYYAQAGWYADNGFPVISAGRT